MMKISDDRLEDILRGMSRGKPGKDCDSFLPLIFIYARQKRKENLEETLTPEEQAMVESHIADCQYCYHELLNIEIEIEKPATDDREWVAALLESEEGNIRALTKRQLFSKDEVVCKYAMKAIERIERNIIEKARQDVIIRLQGDDKRTLDYINKELSNKAATFFNTTPPGEISNDFEYQVGMGTIYQIQSHLAPRLAAGTEDESPIETGIFEDESREFQFEFVLYEDKLLEVSIFRCDRPDLPKEIEIEITNIPNQSPLFCTLKRDEENQRYFCYIEDIPKEVLQTVSQKVPLKLKHLKDCQIIVKDK